MFEYYIDAWKLSELLKNLKEGDKVACNDLGNLMVFRGDRYIGYVDLRNRSIEIFPVAPENY